MCLVCAYNLFVLHISLSLSVFFYEPNIMNNEYGNLPACFLVKGSMA